MSLMRKLAVLGAAAEAARRYAQKNPDKAREFADKAARFADDQTKGKYRDQIENAKRKLADVGGFAEPAPPPPVQATTVIDPATEPAASAPTAAAAPEADTAAATTEDDGQTNATRPTPYKRN